MLTLVGCSLPAMLLVTVPAAMAMSFLWNAGRCEQPCHVRRVLAAVFRPSQGEVGVLGSSPQET